MVKSGELVIVKSGKPVVLALAGSAFEPPPEKSVQTAQALDVLQGVMWSSCAGGY